MVPAFVLPPSVIVGYVALCAVYLLLLPMFPLPVDWLLKAAPVILLTTVVLRTQGLPSLAIALGASALGDILLAQTFPYAFEAGMLAFALAHMGYAATFWPWRSASKAKYTGIALLASVTVAILFILVPQAGHLAVPVSLYALVILFMSATAILATSRPHWMLGVGAGVFVLSDTLIGVHMFLLDSHDRQTSVMLTYYFAQWLLFRGALSRAQAA